MHCSGVIIRKVKETPAKLVSVVHFFVMRCSKNIAFLFVMSSFFCTTITLNCTHIYQFCRGFLKCVSGSLNAFFISHQETENTENKNAVSLCSP